MNGTPTLGDRIIPAAAGTESRASSRHACPAERAASPTKPALTRLARNAEIGCRSYRLSLFGSARLRGSVTSSGPSASARGGRPISMARRSRNTDDLACVRTPQSDQRADTAPDCWPSEPAAPLRSRRDGRQRQSADGKREEFLGWFRESVIFVVAVVCPARSCPSLVSSGPRQAGLPVVILPAPPLNLHVRPRHVASFEQSTVVELESCAELENPAQPWAGRGLCVHGIPMNLHG